MTLLPMTLVSLVSPVSQGRKSLALLAVIVCAAALLLAQTRSSWLGAIVAFLVFGALFLFCRKHVPRQPLGSGERQRRCFQAIVYSLLAVCALGFFVVSSHQSGLLSQRARTLTTTVLQGHEESVEWRLSTWRGTVRMIEDKPFLGWGARCYPLHHAAYTGAGQPQILVLSSGPRIQDEAHNSYLQIAAELGVPGLILWLGVLGAAFTGGIRALLRLPSGGLRHWTLIGALASLAGVCVDALANPAWQFGEVSLYLWIVLGLIGGRAAKTAGGSERSEARVVVQPMWLRPLQIVVAVLVSIWAIVEVIANAHALPVPRL